MKKIIQALIDMFKPTVTTTYYYNDKEVKELPKDIKKKFEEMERLFDKFDKNI